MDITEEILRPILLERELQLVDIEYVKEGSDWFLRVYIDKKGGVNLTECSDVSTILSEKLDEIDPIKGNYYLEVSSPGAERPLKTEQDFIDHIDKNVFISLYAPIDGNKEYEGILKEFKDNTATIEYKVKSLKKQVVIPYDKIAKARLAVVF